LIDGFAKICSVFRAFWAASIMIEACSQNGFFYEALKSEKDSSDGKVKAQDQGAAVSRGMQSSLRRMKFRGRQCNADIGILLCHQK